MVPTPPDVPGGASGENSDGPRPCLPAYGGACIASVIPAVFGALGLGDRVEDTGAHGWLPDPVRDAGQVVVLILDGIGWEQVHRSPSLVPTLRSGEMVKLTSVAPTTTAAALTSISTGLAPSDHGIVGYRVRVTSEGSGEDVLNVLKWRTSRGDARTTTPPPSFQPTAAFCGVDAPVVTRSGFVGTGFTAAHLSGARIIGWQVTSTMVVEVRRRLSAGEKFVHAYYDGLDNVAHEHGLSDHYEAEMRSADRLVADFLEVLPKGASLVVTSDHGQVDVGRSAELPANEVLDASRLVSGEGRFRWFHAKPGATNDLYEAALGAHGDSAWIRTSDEISDDAWLGGALGQNLRERLGDVAIVPHEPIAFLDPADPGETRLAARHGSLTSTEMHVPLVAFGA